MAKEIYIIALMLALLADAPHAQQITGNLEGRVLDMQGQPLAETNITVTGPSLQGTRGSTSDKRGYFRVLALPAGLYTVKISLLGYQAISYDNVSIRLGKTTFMGEIRLQSQAIEMPAITVSGARPLIDPASTTAGGNLVAEDYAILPVERNYRNITTLLPQVNSSFIGDGIGFCGATGLENKYYIDGVDVTDPWRGRTATNLPYNFVKEIEVRAGGYEAEYRSALGGIVNVITYSGGNLLHGQAFGFYANNRFADEPRQGALEPGKGDFAQFDAGLSLGGPLARDKLWFFVAYNPTFEREDVKIPGIRFYNDHSTTHIFAGKLTLRASEKNNLALTISGDPSKRRAVGEIYGAFGTPSAFANPDPYLADLRFGSVNVSLNGNHILNDRFMLATSLSQLRRKEQYLPATDRGRSQPLFIDAANGIWSGGYPINLDDLSVQSFASIKGTLISGNHTLKTGLEYKENRLDHNMYGGAVMSFGATAYLYSFVSQKGTVSNRMPASFIQDSWQLSDRLRINIGLRWDGQFLVGSNAKVVQRINHQFQPRLGLIYQPGETGSQKIFGSFGRFYQELATFLSTLYHIEGSRLLYITYDHDPRLDPSRGDSLSVGTSQIRPEVNDLDGQHFDEFTVGYERAVGKNFKIGLRGVYRTLRDAIEDGHVPTANDFFYGNPGKGLLSIYPKATRDYTSLELTLEKFGSQRFNFLASYVWSRNYGNYSGLFDMESIFAAPNSGGNFNDSVLMLNSTGLLTNDRTHAFKLSGSYRWDFGVTVGTAFSWLSGTPLNEYGGTTIPGYTGFLRQRGTAGRTPSILDFNLRVAYDFAKRDRAVLRPRVILDAFHIGSRRQSVNFEQIHYFDLDENGNQTNPNPIYGHATKYQPPMAVRLGLEVGF